MSVFDPMLNRLPFRTPKEDLEKKHSRVMFPNTDANMQARWPQHNYSSHIHTGFRHNPIAYRCIRTIAEASASLPIKILNGGQEDETHPVKKLLAYPNSYQTGIDLLEDFYTYLLVHGNSYLEYVVGGEHEGGDFYSLRPDRMKLVPGRDGRPVAYEYMVNGQTTRFAQDEHAPSILHVKMSDPLDDHYGYSPLASAAAACEVHNTACQWNKSLFDNAARPSGALVYRGVDGAPHLTDEQFDRLKLELEENFQGARNVGRPLLLEGGLEWSAISLSPQDMDFIQAKHSAARDIALAFGVPPMLLGIPGDNTYANYAEANRALWRQTILPLVQRSLRAIERHLAHYYADLKLTPDLNQLPALSEERNRLWDRVGAADYLTVNEKREMVGLPPLDAGDVDEGDENAD